MENDPPRPPPPLTYGIFHMFRHFFFESFPYTVLSVEFQSLLSQIIKVVTKLKSVLIVAKFYF